MRTQRRPLALAAAALLTTALTVGGFTSNPAAAHDTGGEASVQAFEDLRWCESENDYGIDTGNGYYGAYQFSAGTWRSLGYSGLPHEAPPEVQDEAARKLQARSGWGQWPACSRRIGAR